MTVPHVVEGPEECIHVSFEKVCLFLVLSKSHFLPFQLEELTFHEHKAQTAPEVFKLCPPLQVWPRCFSERGGVVFMRLYLF
jgi:hypothetical protein